ncbi:MAG: UvrD-helicase domain-containing protein [Terracidiphilus sp.]|jgi:ATP-dependent exoDNAse (exonuclease V) beta subunit
MSKTPAKSLPPDQPQREQALDPARSILVQAPAGSGKTDLLTRRFLRLLAEVDEPGQVVAITFTIAAAAEMRNRILGELEKAAAGRTPDADGFSMDSLAHRALEHSQALGWKLLDLPAQLRVRTIDSFCRELALQQPLLSGLGGGLEIAEQPDELYRRAARQTLEQIDEANSALCEAIAALLLWRDNNWQEMENLLVEMLKNRDRWMQDFVFVSEQGWDKLRERLERPMAADSIRYTEDEWKIVKACFTLLRQAAAELEVVYAEAGRVDYTEVAQIAQRALRGDDNLPTDAALAVSDGIRHLLVDEFQDTSRRQHQLLASLIAAWPEREGRTCFVVGDPMQSIYFFREADAELFPRVKEVGLEIPHDEPLLFDIVPLTANFRTVPGLVAWHNQAFKNIFAVDDGSGVRFSSARPFPKERTGSGPPFTLHLRFVPQAGRGKSADSSGEKEDPRDEQIQEIVALIHSHMEPMEQARAHSNGEEKKKYRIAVLGRTRKSLVPIAQALREFNNEARCENRETIPFRAIELENLKDRPEVLDALSLARALFNPHDRVAWLGVLRAPWCGLALDDLHLLASADDPKLLARPVPELLAERLPLLSEPGRRAAQRALNALNSVPAFRASASTASLGTWLEQVWLNLGGADCVDSTARANVDLLWNCVDRLPAGEQDMLSPALDAALDKLTALPDPEASSDFGVQLMTIHKSKGLEFEVVIVPDLQAGTAHSGRKMLSWLELGLAQPDDSGEITEFLIAPFQPKGKERGKAKEWVDRVYRERESQEDRRLLYVAATRARDELHIFARPAYKVESNGEFSLAEPSGSLLATAWPALEKEVRARFEIWKADRAKFVAGKEQVIESIAASGESNLLVFPSAVPTPARPTLLRRLPPDYRPAHSESSAPAATEAVMVGMGSTRLYTRHEGGLLSRALGAAVHALLEELARLRATNDWNASRAALQRFSPRIAAQVRASGVYQAHAANIAAQALQLALSASRDPIGQWILSPHAEAASEVRWAGVVAGALSTVRVDRVFRAGPQPQSEGEDCWWIIDYKTAHADSLDPAAALPELRKLFAPQLEAYAEILRNLHGQDASIRAGLYYPRMLLLDWWER